jgi:hypothetical protein
MRGDCGGVPSSSSVGPAMALHETKKKTSEEEQKGLALLGRCCKALTLNLLTQALTSSYLAPQDGEGNQQVSNLEEGVLVLA